jgi:hypothetical protein
MSLTQKIKGFFIRPEDMEVAKPGSLDRIAPANLLIQGFRRS